VIEQILQADRYLQVDQVERARDVYQRVVDLDPGNAIAVVGLARCALAEGDDQRAYELASRALEIDPENDMARRMEARLSEILTNRGEGVERPNAASSPSPREMRPVVTPAAAETVVEPAAAETVVDTNGAQPTAAAAPAPAAPPTRGAGTTAPSPSPKEQPVRKSLFDRLMGR
jgi:tetratricopeptide (TPR) repeat protein